MIDYEELKRRIQTENYPDFISQYCKKFRGIISDADKTIIKKGTVMYRARVGNDYFEGDIDDLDCVFDIPYFGIDMEAPPSRYAGSGRFNREGISYLYLADKIETCIAEIHLQVGQVCSVARFRCIKDGAFVEIDKNSNKDELKKLYYILTKPVHSGTKDYYQITQFFSDIFLMMRFDGIVFPSSQSEGKNIVVFNKKLFEQEKYSERMYHATKIVYEFEAVNDGYEQYHDYRTLLNSGNIEEEEKRESKYRYIEDKIEYYDNKLLLDKIKDFKIENKDEFLKSLQNTKCKQKAYEFVGAYYLNNDQSEGIDYFYQGMSFTIPDAEHVLKRIRNCKWVNNKDICDDEAFRTRVKSVVDEQKKKHAVKVENSSKRLRGFRISRK